MPAALFVPATVWFGLMAGFFFAYSATVMGGLAATDAETAIAAMQAINAHVRNPAFGLGFWGSVVVALSLALACLARPLPGRIWVLAAAGLYLAGAIAVTILGNVPMNMALASVDPAAPGATATMARYIADWTWLNHIRTLAALAACLLVAVALTRKGA